MHHARKRTGALYPKPHPTFEREDERENGDDPFVRRGDDRLVPEMSGGKAQRPSRIARLFLTVAGCLAAGLGVAGIFLPLLPTTPFLLLAAACFARGSESLYRRLIENRWTGPYIRVYRRGRGLPRRAKAVLVCLLWATLSVSAYLVPLWWVWLALAGVGVGVGGFVLSLPTLEELEESEETRRLDRPETAAEGS